MSFRAILIIIHFAFVFLFFVLFVFCFNVRVAGYETYFRALLREDTLRDALFTFDDIPSYNGTP